jgi:hypothetical protein
MAHPKTTRRRLRRARLSILKRGAPALPVAWLLGWTLLEDIPMNRRRLTPFAFFFTGLVLGGCAPIAQIHYDQLGACTRATRGDGLVVDAPPSHAIMLFRVKRIDNSKPSTSWRFDPARMQVKSPSPGHSNLGSSGPLVVPAHGVLSVSLPMAIMVKTANADGSDAGAIKSALVYPNEPEAPGTASVNDSLSTPSLPFKPDCNELSGG